MNLRLAALCRHRRASLAVTLLLLCATPAWAQSSAPSGAEQVAAERARIGTERARIATRFAQEERLCHQRFAVNDCLNRNLASQRDALADLRRQEILLNDGERQRNAAQRLERLDEKAQNRAPDTPAAPAAAPRVPNAPPQPPGGKLPQSGEPAARAPDREAIRQHEQRMQDKQARHAEAQARRAEQAAQADDAERRYQSRVREAEERKARIQQRNAAEPSQAKPLPEPTPP